MAENAEEVVVRDVLEQNRFELTVGGRLAGFTEYRRLDGTYALQHTEIDPTLEGRGLGSTLVRGELDQLRERGVSVLPYCPFVRAFLGQHPEYVDLVPADRRDEFGL
jgi:predicted GNAT family acetyltransferase